MHQISLGIAVLRLVQGLGTHSFIQSQNKNTAGHWQHFGLLAKERRIPQLQIGALAFLDAADFMRDAMSNHRVDGVFGDIATDPQVIIVA